MAGTPEKLAPITDTPLPPETVPSLNAPWKDRPYHRVLWSQMFRTVCVGPLASPSEWLQALGATISDIVWEDVTCDYSMVALNNID